MMLSPPLVDHTRYFRHAPGRLRVDANMFDLALGDAAVCLLRPLWPAKGATGAGCGVMLAVRGDGGSDYAYNNVRHAQSLIHEPDFFEPVWTYLSIALKLIADAQFLL